ncbi:MAG: hypothetical protein ACRDJN_19615 [Chloroflexota bacterium]
MIISDGTEGGTWTLRAVTGGVGRYTGATGFCTQQEASTNNTTIRLASGIEIPAPNFEFHFRLT